MLTRSAALLFGRSDRTRVEIRAGEAFVPIAGSIFRVLDRTLEALAELNQPFRLKGPTSEDVRRFDPRAIKELAVNALAHRDHDREEPVRIRLSPRELTVVSPGGLVPGLRPELLGQRGERAYRNPVIADLLYGCGAMDERGSGLADVRRWTRLAGGESTFAATQGGDAFIASLTTRDLDPDPVTRTADPGDVEHFIANAVPVTIAGRVCAAPSPVLSRREVRDAHPDVLLPAFAFGGGRLLTFADPEGPGTVFARHWTREPSITSARELAADPDDESVLVQLLNSVMIRWAGRRGLYSDGGRRLWFPRSEEGPLEVTYRARARSDKDRDQAKRLADERFHPLLGARSGAASRSAASATRGRCTWCHPLCSRRTATAPSFAGRRSGRSQPGALRATTTPRFKTTSLLALGPDRRRRRGATRRRGTAPFLVRHP